MNGAQIVIKTAVSAGIKICFANPGTTEMPLVEALDSVPGIAAKLGLFEGCCTGAADGYARMSGIPALTLLHLGPGLANGIANLHNAHRARTPVVNLIGEHASWHRSANAPLSMNIESLASVIPGWQKTSTGAETLSRDMADAISAALAGQVATLIIPQDFQWAHCADETIASPFFSHDPPDEDRMASAIAALQDKDTRTLIIIGGKALNKNGLLTAAKMQYHTGCGLLSDAFPARTELGTGLPALDRIPYFPEHAKEKLSQYDTIILIGTKPIVSFFGYKDVNCQLLSESQTVIRLDPGLQDLQQILDSLAERLGASGLDHKNIALSEQYKHMELPGGSLTGGTISKIIAALLPKNTIVMEEAVTSGSAYSKIAANAKPHSLMTLTGGALGQGMPCATGAALACPDRPVVCFSGDGAAMYTPQSLWMQARNKLNITTLICANHSYDILKLEYHRAGYKSPKKNTAALTNLNNPFIDWVSMSRGMGVPAESVTSPEKLIEAFKKDITIPCLHLVEIVM